MPTKTKKHQVKTVVSKPTPAPAKKQKPEAWIQGSDILPLTLIVLYLLVDFIPRFEGADVMGAQWIYLVLVNVASMAYLFLNRKNMAGALVAVGKNSVSLAFTALYVLAGFSIFIALNRIEAYVVYARFSTAFIAFASMAVMLYNRPNLFTLLAQVLSIFLLIQSVDLLRQFFAGYETTDLTTLVNELKSNSGNKNIMAASLVMKIPFAAYCIYKQKLFGKIFNTAVVSLGALTVFFINARASFLSLILVSLMFLAYVVYEYFQQKNLNTLLKRVGLYFIPLILIFIAANIILESKKQFEELPSGYGSVAERLSTISLSKQANSLRMNQYRSAISYIKDHPLMGCGIGNWKLASIPYERTYSDEMYISYHVHNDFLEYTAELGLPGGLLYLSIYLLMAFFGLKVILSKTASQQHKQWAVFSLMALAVYFIDAMFNFPVERPIMQVYLGFIMALHINIYLAWKNTKEEKKNFAWLIPAFAAVALALMIFSFYFNRQVYKSMVGQAIYNSDMLSGSPVYKSAQVVPALPEIPNLNVFGFPIDAIKARYYLAEKKYDSALYYLNRSMLINPYITYNEFLKGNLFLETGNLDSAYYYAAKAFFMKPRAKSNYQLFNAVLAQRRDTAMAKRAFYEARQYRNEPWLWNDYISIMYILGKDHKYLYQMADSAIKYFPDDAELQKKHKELQALQNVPRQ